MYLKPFRKKTQENLLEPPCLPQHTSVLHRTDHMDSGLAITVFNRKIHPSLPYTEIQCDFTVTGNVSDVAALRV